MSWPNRVTAARILLIWPFVVCLLNEREWSWARWAALLVFAVMALTDVLDGYLARRLDVHTPLGKFLDPLADKLLVTCAVVILAMPGSAVTDAAGDAKLLPNWAVAAAIGKDVVVLLGFVTIYLATGRVFICPRPAGKACTGVQFAMLVALLAWPDMPAALNRLPDVLWWAATLMAGVAVADYIRIGTRFVGSVGEPTDRKDDSREQG